MKKQLKWALLLFVAVLTSVSLAACSDDDDDKDAPSTGSYSAKQFVGYWESDEEYGWTLQINADGRGTDYENGEYYDSFSWSYDAGKNRLFIEYDGDSPWIFSVISVTSNKLVLADTEDGEIYSFTKRK